MIIFFTSFLDWVCSLLTNGGRRQGDPCTLAGLDTSVGRPVPVELLQRWSVNQTSGELEWVKGINARRNEFWRAGSFGGRVGIILAIYSLNRGND